MLRNTTVVLALLASVAVPLISFADQPAVEKVKKTDALSDSTVLAVVADTKITVKDYKAEVSRLPENLLEMTKSEQGKSELIDTMVLREMILKQARIEGIEKSQDYVAKLEDIKKRLIVEQFLKQTVEKKAVISDAEMKEYYDKNMDEFKKPETIKVSHILVKTPEAADDILSQLKKGADFEKLAKDFSIDDTSEQGGDLGWFARGVMVPDFETAAFELNDGQISNVVKTEFGFHIIKLMGRNAAGVLTFDEVKSKIKKAITDSKSQEIFAKVKEELKNKMKYTVNYDDLNRL